jgi:hypothetical protein
LVRYGQIVFPASALMPPLRGIHPFESLESYRLPLYTALRLADHRSSDLHIHQQDHQQRAVVQALYAQQQMWDQTFLRNHPVVQPVVLHHVDQQLQLHLTQELLQLEYWQILTLPADQHPYQSTSFQSIPIILDPLIPQYFSSYR